jgi:hypothetical protein
VDLAGVSTLFKLAFSTLLILTIFFAVLAVIVSLVIADPTKSQRSAENWLFGAASSTLSALIGMLAGRVA